MRIDGKKPIRSFSDLDVYQRSYNSMITIMKEVVPKLPDIERNDLRTQISRSCKAIPRLIAEGYAKRHQRRGFHKYIDDSMAESNETVVSLMQIRDLYSSYIDPMLCEELIKSYEITGRQLYNLSMSWTNFEEKSKSTS